MTLTARYTPNARGFPRRMLAFAFTVLLLGVGGQAFAQTKVPLPPNAAPPKPGLLNLSNVLWDSVRVEVRSGPSTDCAQNPLVAVIWVKRGRVWAIKSADSICWRREVIPGSALNTWTGWIRRVVPPDQKADDPLQTATQ